MSLFDQIDRKKRKKLMCSIDYLNNILGKNKVRVASQGVKENLDLKGAICPHLIQQSTQIF